MVLGLFGKGYTPTQHSLAAEYEIPRAERSLKACNALMNDQIAEARAGLEEGDKSGNSVNLMMGRAMLKFVEAALGVEADVIAVAGAKLADTASQAASDLSRAKKEPRIYRSQIYPVGTEYSMILSEAQLLGTVCALLSQNITESMKGFIKLRKAHSALGEIINTEKEYMRKKRGIPARSASIARPQSTEMPGGFGVPGGFGGWDEQDHPTTQSGSVEESQLEDAAHNLSLSSGEAEDDDDSDDEFFDADGSEAIPKADEESTKPKNELLHPNRRMGSLEIGGAGGRAIHSRSPSSQRANSISHVSSGTPEPPSPSFSEQRPDSVTLLGDDNASLRSQLTTTKSARSDRPEEFDDYMNLDPDAEEFKNVLDEYVHSGANLCYGMTYLILSFLPPTLGKLISIIGFKGDRRRGLHLIWEASKFDNIHGATAGLTLLAYSNGLLSICDVKPENTSDDGYEDRYEGYPIKKLSELLQRMRKRYPDSHLWLNEEARMLAAQKKLDEAIALLSGPRKSPMKQINALACFETGLACMMSLKLQKLTDQFIELSTINDWSHGMYFYIAGSAQLELYRQSKVKGDDKAMQKYLASFNELFEKSRKALAGSKKILGQNLPFDKFIMRKFKKWEDRVDRSGLPLHEAIGVSPYLEMAYHWSGMIRMNDTYLKQCHEILDYSTRQPTWADEAVDEKALLGLVRGCVLRYQKNYTAAIDVLQSEVLRYPNSTFTSGNRENYVGAFAHYEMGAMCWERRGRGANETSPESKKKLKECSVWMEKVNKWGSYDLDDRLGAKVMIALDTLKNWKTKFGKF